MHFDSFFSFDLTRHRHRLQIPDTYATTDRNTGRHAVSPKPQHLRLSVFQPCLFRSILVMAPVMNEPRIQLFHIDDDNDGNDDDDGDGVPRLIRQQKSQK